jgi:hypothetical protein
MSPVPRAEPLPIALRAFCRPLGYDTEPPDPDKPTSKPTSSDWVLVFDVETETDAAQERRVLGYQVRHLGELRGHGIAYEPEALTAAELDLLTSYCKERELELVTTREFVEELFMPLAYDLAGLVIGFNLPFDLSRIAAAHTGGRGRFRGGFLFRLSESNRKPRLRVKHLNRHAALFEFSAPEGRSPEARNREKGGASGHHRGFFCDVKTIGDALTGQSNSLASIARLLATPHQKPETEEHGGPLTVEYLDYTLNDPQVTWECFQCLKEMFEAHGLSTIDLHLVKSEASLGKATLRQIGVRPWRQSQPDASARRQGQILSAYYGGRAAVRQRHQVVQVQYCDFRAMYPTVCALMGIWQFVIGEGVQVRDATDEVREQLASFTLDDLQRPGVWRDLTVLVEVESDADLFPVRADYTGSGQLSIGLNYLTGGRTWFTLADVLVRILLTGKPPRIRRAIRFRPGPAQKGLKPLTLLGNPAYRVDPYKDDFYKRLVELRAEIKRQKKAAEAAGDKATAELLDAAQQGIKILANATSYGIFVELNLTDLNAAHDWTVYGHAGRFTSRIRRREQPGEYFHPLLGTLITGAARLLLTLAETVAEREGLGWAICDTDSMAFSKPDAMLDLEFYERAGRVCGWFQPLSPYADDGPLLEVEDVNYALDTDGKPTSALQPLYCFAISAKRYALFSISPDGKPILRKASAHGLGHLVPPYTDNNAPADTPAPVVALSELGVLRWQHDLWYRIIETALAGQLHEARFDDLPGFDRPAMASYAATTTPLLAWFKSYNEGRPYAEQVRPFGFFNTPLIAPDGYPAGHDQDSFQLIAPYEPDPSRWTKHRYPNRHNPDGPTYAISTVVRGGGIVRVRSYAEVALHYLFHPESKSLGPDGKPCSPTTVGELSPRHIHAVQVDQIGKETNRLEDNGLLDVADAYMHYPEAGGYWATLILPALLEFPRVEVARLADVSRRELTNLLACRAEPTEHTLKRLTRAAARLARERLRAASLRPQPNDLAALHHFKKLTAEQPRRCASGCGRPVDGPRRRHCNACKQAAYRRRLV